MKKMVLFGLVMLAMANAALASFQDCRGFFPSAPPAVTGAQLRELCFEDFAVLHSGQTKTPVYVVERLTRQALDEARGEVRTDEFYPEARLPIRDRASLDDYRGSGFDRGHMAPAADRSNPRAMAQSFSLANMVPQAPANNRKTWAKIERDTRKYVLRSGHEVYVFTGPAFLEDRGYAGHVKVPSHLFKLVYDADARRSWAHWVENIDEARIGRPISHTELQQYVGIRFIPD